MEKLLSTLVLGIAMGSTYSLASTGLVLTYRISGVLNFGYGAVAMFGGFVFWHFTTNWSWAPWLALLVVLVVVAPAMGFFLESQLFRRIQGQPMVIVVIATVGLTVLLQGLVYVIWGPDSRAAPSLFPDRSFDVFGLGLSSDEIAPLAIAAVAALALAALFRYTRTGIAFKAVVDNRAVAGLAGVNTGRVAARAWAIGTAFAMLTGILVGPLQYLDPVLMPLQVISYVFGAAIFGYLRSLPLAFVGGLVVGTVQTALIQYVGGGGMAAHLAAAVPFAFVTGAVLLAPRSLRVAQAAGSFVVRTRELRVRAGARQRTVLALATFGTLALVPVLTAGKTRWVDALLQGMALSLIFLSIVILTGFSGQISLGHTALMGISVFTASHLTVGRGWSMWLALPVAALAAVPAGALLGLIAVRLHGLFLALLTLGFAFMAYDLFFADPRISGGFAGAPLPRPEGTEGQTGYYYLVLAVLGAASLLAVNLRTGRTGRVLAAMRDSETAARALGIDVARYKVVIFSLSAFIAGLGGILNETIVGRAGQNQFTPFLSVFYVTIAVVGGIFHVGGAIVSGLAFALYPAVLGNIALLRDLQFIFFGLGSTLALANNPEGLYGELRRGASWAADAIARRRGRAQPLPVAGGQDAGAERGR